jgi:hypothetical protein
LLSRGAAKRLRLEQLPGYAPELNPDEGICAYLKYVELRNAAAPTWANSTTTCAWPRPGFATSAPSFVVASPIAVTLFRTLPGARKTYQGCPHGMPRTQADTINTDLLAFVQS